mgnify:CR=1 FL=1
MNRIEMYVNNGRTMQLAQNQCDEEITLTTYNTASGLVDREETISAGDMVTLMNWYRYQKDNGNTNLSF